MHYLSSWLGKVPQARVPEIMLYGAEKENGDVSPGLPTPFIMDLFK